jgi:hypothetical protein
MPVLTTADYKVLESADAFVAKLADGDNEPAKQTIAISSATATALTVTALTAKIYEGTYLKKGTAFGVATADAAVGATSVPIRTLSGSNFTAGNCEIYVTVPIYAVRSFSDSGSETALELNSFSADGKVDEIVTQRRFSIQCSAYNTKSGTANPGLDLIKEAARKTKSAATLYFEFVDEDGEGIKGFANVKSPNRRREAGQAFEYSWTFGVSGDLYELGETINVA